MKNVCYDQEWVSETKDFEVYYMYRDLYLDGDKDIIRKNDLRYDITVIPSNNFGKEYAKTKGH